MIEEIKKKIRDVPDFPKKGIMFKDITPVLGDPKAFKGLIDFFRDRYKDQKIEHVVGVETRGLILASALAYSLNTGLALIRKPGKLPYQTHKVVYDLEYGSDQIQIHTDALRPGEKVVIIDDLLATGGTARASAELVGKLGAQIHEISFMVELSFLKGREKLKQYPIFSMMQI